MKKTFTTLLLLLLLLPSYSYGDTVPGDVIVVLRNNSGVRISSLSAAGGIKSMSVVKSLVKSSNVSIKSIYNALSEQGDYIFMVVHSDNKDEKELLREIRRNDCWKALPVYAVTADAEMQDSCEELGFTGVLLKPITMDKLRKLLS